jgi:hypothetical protein
LTPILDATALRVERERWQSPKTGEPCVTIYPYDELIDEYEDEDVDRLVASLAGLPTSIMCIELRGSQGSRACDCATGIVVAMLSQFDEIADDLLSACWTLEEITSSVTKNGKRFLDCYRG